MDILLVEDDPGDVALAREVFEACSQKIALSVVESGEKALEYLRKTHPFENVASPDIILLDLNMPRMNGRRFLEIVKADRETRRIPVIVLTTSASEDDIDRCYELGANCYLQKPMSFGSFVELVRQVEVFWLNVAKIPSKI